MNDDPTRHPAAAPEHEWWVRRLTRGAVARELGTSITSVRRLEGKKLHPIKGANRLWAFDPAEVERLKPKTNPPVPKRDPVDKGELAGEVFTLFNEGKGFRHVVAIVHQHPRVVRELYDQWYENGDMWLSRKEVRRIRAVQYRFESATGVDAINTGDDVVHLVEILGEELVRHHEILKARDSDLSKLRKWKESATMEFEQLRTQATPAAPPDPPPPSNQTPAAA